MPDLNFSVEKAVAAAYAAVPMLNFTLRVSESAGATVHAVALRCQIRIEPVGRLYDADEQSRLADLFGPVQRWGQTLRAMLWTHASVVIPSFQGSTSIELPVPCTFDFNVAATKYFDALAHGQVPLNLLFSGTIFHESEAGHLQVAQISWEKEATFRLPIQTWKDMMEMYYPNEAWLCLRKDVFESLQQYKSSLSLPTWEAAVARLLEASPEKAGA